MVADVAAAWVAAAIQAEEVATLVVEVDIREAVVATQAAEVDANVIPMINRIRTAAVRLAGAPTMIP